MTEFWTLNWHRINQLWREVRSCKHVEEACEILIARSQLPPNWFQTKRGFARHLEAIFRPAPEKIRDVVVLAYYGPELLQIEQSFWDYLRERKAESRTQIFPPQDFVAWRFFSPMQIARAKAPDESNWAADLSWVEETGSARAIFDRGIMINWTPGIEPGSTAGLMELIVPELILAHSD